MKYLSFFKQTDEVYEGHDTYVGMDQHSLGINDGHTLSSPGRYITMGECHYIQRAKRAGYIRRVYTSTNNLIKRMRRRTQ